MGDAADATVFLLISIQINIITYSCKKIKNMLY